jgi:hypothetical protein
MKLNQSFPHDLLIELMQLREKKDPGAIFDKLYQYFTVTESEIDFIKNLLPEFRDVLPIMIKHFSDKEEYEKCAVLRNL